MQIRADMKPVVYLDETWANAHDGKDLAWVERDATTGGTLGGVTCPSGKGARLIILGAGGTMEWIPNTALIFHSKKNTGDYHDEECILRSGFKIAFSQMFLQIVLS